MTLNTEVYLSGPIGGQQAYALAVAAILSAADRSAELASVRHADPEVIRDGVVALSTSCGQGLPGWTWCYYRPDGPLNMEDTWEDGWQSAHRCTVNVSWDTAYGYQDNQGGCGDLHHRALRILRGSLPSGVGMRWVDEFTGEMHEGAPEPEWEPVA